MKVIVFSPGGVLENLTSLMGFENLSFKLPYCLKVLPVYRQSNTAVGVGRV